MARIARRGLLLGALGAPLAACGGRRSDIPAVTAALQEAVEARPEYRDGQVQFQDSSSAGTFINGVLTLEGADRDAVASSLEAVLEAVIRAYQDEPDVRAAQVRLEAHPAHDAGTRVLTADVVPPSEDSTTTTDDLDEHFGI